jgi:hypothetical protein
VSALPREGSRHTGERGCGEEKANIFFRKALEKAARRRKISNLGVFQQPASLQYSSLKDPDSQGDFERMSSYALAWP